jgi:hypothetical protein
VEYVSEGCLTDKQAETRISITFTATNQTAVLAWGGHIALESVWGTGQGASGVSGSPYHMRVKGWTLGNLGNQDRSLSAAAVILQNTGVVTQLQEVGTTNVGLAITVDVGDSVQDVATVTPSSATGDVSFRYYSNSTDCEAARTAWTGTGTGSGGTLVSTNAVSGGTATSSSVTLAPGTYYWLAFFEGDVGFVSSVSACNEVLTVNQATPAMGTAPTVSVVNNDTATLSGLYCPASPCGTVSFELYQGDNTCTNAAAKLTPTGLGPFNVTGNGNYSTANTTAVSVTADTVFYWKVVFSGDTNNAANSSNCVESVDIDITGDAGP